MRLVRFGPIGAERPGVLIDDDHALDVGDHVGDFDRAFFARGGLDALRPIVAAGDGPVIALDGIRLGSPRRAARQHLLHRPQLRGPRG